MSKNGSAPAIPQRYAAKTNVGCVREHNEDSFVAQSPLFVVADGMGGHEAGEVASEIAINTMIEYAPRENDGNALIEAVREANRAIFRGAQDGTGRPGMGTTITAAVIVDDKLLIAQVGDSRAYLLHEGNLQRLTRDHSLVAELVDAGRITEEEARVHPQRSVITRALGSDPNIEPDLYILHVEEGDRLMLCSDGLSSMIRDDAIESILKSVSDPEDCCNNLVREALAAGGLDNVTCIVVDPLTKESTIPAKAKGKGRKPKQKGRFAPLIWTLAFVAILAIAGFGFGYYVQHVYYVIDDGGYVAVYRGLPGQFAGIKLSWLEEKTDIEVSKLAPSTASRLESGIALDSLEEGDNLISQYRSSIGTTTSSNTSSNTSSTNTSANTGTNTAKQA